MDAVEVARSAAVKRVVPDAATKAAWAVAAATIAEVAADAAVAALLAKGGGDPVVLMPADEDGRVEVRRADGAGRRTDPRGRTLVRHYVFEPIEDGEE